MIWLPLYGLFYAAVTLYWARVAARENGDVETYFSAGHSVAPWISALVIAGATPGVLDRKNQTIARLDKDRIEKLVK